jgi:hypothetical protein
MPWMRVLVLVVLVAELVAPMGRPAAQAVSTDPGTTEQVSVRSGTTEPGNHHSSDPDISADGRWVVFQSLANNLDPTTPDTNGWTDIYVHDRVNRTTRLVVTPNAFFDCSVDCRGLYDPSISPDGAVVAFTTDVRLVPEDFGFDPDVYVQRLDTVGATPQLVSYFAPCWIHPSNPCTPSSAGGHSPSISDPAPGGNRYVAFASDADELADEDDPRSDSEVVPDEYGDARPNDDVFRKDITTLEPPDPVSAKFAEDMSSTLNGPSGQPSISADGIYVAFTSLATDVDEDFNGAAPSVFRQHVPSGTTILISPDLEGRDGSQPSISGDGNRVAFVMGEPVAGAFAMSGTDFGGAAVGDSNCKDFTFANGGDGALTIDSIESTSPDFLVGFFCSPGLKPAVKAPGPTANELVGECSPGVTLLSGDWCTLSVTFSPTSPGFKEGDIVIRHNPAPESTETRIHVTGTCPCEETTTTTSTLPPPATSTSTSTSSTTPPASPPPESLRPAQATSPPTSASAPTGVSNSTRSVSQSPAPTTTTAGTLPSRLTAPGGSVPIAYSAQVANPNKPFLFGEEPSNGVKDVFVRDVAAETLTWVSSRDPSLCPSPCVPEDAVNPDISLDGSTVGWESESSDFVPADTNDAFDVFVRDLFAARSPTDPNPPGPIERISVTNNEGQTEDEADSNNPALSRDGRVVAFDSESETLVGTATTTAVPSAALPSSPMIVGPSPPPTPTVGPPAPAPAGPVALVGPVQPAPAAAQAPPSTTSSTSTTLALPTLLGPRTQTAAPLVGPAPPKPNSDHDSACFPNCRDVFVRERASVPVLTPNPVEFGPVEVGGTSGHQIITLTNTGPGPLVISAPPTVGPGFEIVNGPGTTCVPGTVLRRNQSCTVEVRFRPTSVGTTTSQLTVPFAGGTSSTATLQGTGAAPNIGAPAQDWGVVGIGVGQGRDITIRNNGTSSQTLGQLTITGANPGDFSLSNDTCSNTTLAPGATCTVRVIFTPTAAGPRSATLTAPIGTTGQTMNVPLTGIGAPPNVQVSPTPVDFGEVIVGQTSPDKVVTITNGGPGPVTITEVTLTSGAPDYAIKSNDCVGKTLAVGQSCTITLTFKPSAGGARPGEVTVKTTNAGDVKIPLTGTGQVVNVTIEPNPLDFGNVAVGTTVEKETTVKVPGVLAPPNGSFNIGGPDAGDFSIASRECTSALPEGTTCKVRIRFTPSAAGPRTATLTGTMGPANTPFTVDLKGAGGVPTPVLAPDPVDFGSVVVGTSSGDVAVTLTNAGDGLLKPGAATVGGDHAADFTVVGDGCTGKELPRDGTCTVTLRFTPVSTGARSGSLAIAEAGTVGLAGTGADPAPPPGSDDTPPPGDGGGTTPPPGGNTTPPPGGGDIPPGGGTTPPPGQTPPGTGPGPSPTGVPTIRLSRPLGPPGIVTYVEGSGFRPNTTLQLRWLADPTNPTGRVIAVTTVTTDANGAFPPVAALIFHNDSSGARMMEANGGPDQIASASFLVVPATVQPSGNEALTNRRTLLLQRR